MTWREGRCISFGQAIPFLPLIEPLRENFRIEESDGEPEIIAKVEHSMHRMGEVAAHIPAMRYLLGVDPGDPAMAAMDAAARRKKIFDAGLATSVRGAHLRPMVLVCEDLHWSDTSTEEYLSVLMDAVAAAPLLLLVTYRVGYTPPFGSRSFHTTLNQLRGDFDQSLVYFHEGVALAERVPAGFWIAFAAFGIGNADTAKGEDEEALQWYRRLSDYAAAAGDKFWLARIPNVIGGVHLELFDLDEAIRLNLEGDEVAATPTTWLLVTASRAR